MENLDGQEPKNSLASHYIPSVVSIVAGSALLLVAVFSGQGLGLNKALQARLQAMRSSASGVLSTTPNPLQVCSGGNPGSVVFSWALNENPTVELRQDGKDGKLIYQGVGSGSFTLNSPANGSNFYLYKVVTNTSYSWRYVRGQGWAKTPSTSTDMQEVGNSRITYTQDGCNVLPPVTTTGAPISGTFIYPQTLSDASIEQSFAEIESLGMDTVIISQTKGTGATCGSYDWGTGFPGKLTTIFDSAERHNLKVYTGLILSYSPNCTWPDKNVVAITEDLAATIATQYGNRSSFAGWYIPDEPSLAVWDPQFATSYYEYYNALVKGVKAKLNKPVMIAPILGGANGQSPAQIASKALAFQQAVNPDIQAWQDSVQTYSVNLGWTKRGTPTVAEYWRAIAGALGKNKFWADAEIGNCCELWSGGGYYPASFDRVVKQLDAGQYAGKTVVWLQQLQMTNLKSSSQYVVAPGASRLLASYKARYGLDSALAYLKSSYMWITAPSANYPDSGNELTNSIAGDPKRFDDPEWVGILGNPEIELNFGSSKKIDWVGVHLLNETAPSILFPSKLALSCSQDGVNFTSLGSWNLPIQPKDSEYVFSNPAPLGAECSDMRVKFTGSSWTFLSELEIVAKR